MKTNRPLVSVIIPAFNEEKVIGRLLDSLKNQSYKRIEIIVVDDASRDSTPIIAKKYTNKVYSRSHKERSVQRNFGAKRAKGKFLFFLDADMELSISVVKECVEKMLQSNKIGAIVIPEESVAKNYWEEVKAFERSFYNLEGDNITDAARFISKSAFNKVGGYDENITGPEDWDLPDSIGRKGYKIARVKSLIYHYERVPNPIKLARKKYYYGLKSHRYLGKHNISVLSPKTVYFLRPVFYKNWRKLVTNPSMSLGMLVMMTCELIGGGFGFVIGKIRHD